MSDNLPRMDYHQHRRARRLVHECCLPLDGELSAALLYRGSRKRCAVCGAAFVPKSNRGKYCSDCAAKVRRRKEAERQRKRYHLSTHLGAFKPL
jgi:hypothetical protein